jgi:putative SOS response-associated peptidase YedK
LCTNYRPTARDHLRESLQAGPPDFDYPQESYPGYLAPIVRRSEDGGRECLAASFGLLPHWAKDRKLARHTYNARSETVAEKPSFRQAWRRRQWCLVPMEAFYEPCYESGRAVRWKIARPDGAPFAVAGIWDRWVDPQTGEVVHSFSMLTVNADGHPVLGRMFAPEDEKRSLVVIDAADHAAWLEASTEQARAMLLPPAPGALQAEPSPRPESPRKPRR